VKTTYLYQTAVIEEMGLSEYDRILTKIKQKFKNHGAKIVLMNFLQKRCKNNSG